jgi:hypothetical protein
MGLRVYLPSMYKEAYLMHRRTEKKGRKKGTALSP